MASVLVQNVAAPAADSLPADASPSKVTLDGAIKWAKAAYTQRLPASKSQYESATRFLPGGNTRSVLFNDPFPIFMKRGQGNRLWDLDGHEYVDFVGELTAGLYGHSNPILKETIASTYENVGISFGASTTQEVALAQLICERFPSIEQLRFCNSGTEANLYALSIARVVTGKNKILAFKGGYHGGVLSFGHGIAKNTVDRDDWVLGTYNDVEEVTKLIASTPGLAAVIVEAMQGAGGCIPATVEFLEAIQATAKKCGVLVILDEVMTSRLHPHGLQGKYSLDPDLTTLGKYIGGGLAFGAFGGKSEHLAVYDPRRASSVAHSGTFNNNTLAMSCGAVGLSQIYTPDVSQQHNELGDYFRTSLQTVAEGTKMVVTGIGAVLTIHFLENGLAPVREADLDEQTVSGLKTLFWHWCLSRSFWITERGMLSIILGTTREELDGFVETARLFVAEYRHLLAI
ncbi:putative glutamate-1-semialdehyde 2,1-aminomutase [Microdochium trichocladiopsis]|uniref:Glutamate-1-semialdehyde 2,1-aminomutase n=1 Tax=Microdochium trichocladiopsis TaxID=1682393 RepID=A0A9P9BMX6_9PEZI|nr:putative glutamate-1-semialdehyde 2,1-aminomutase [Microdochium trichocladiopsis]KAH7026725.1 putative glutamate-1-semialdehyde 2,1-aminomutase [Microdochium trichocladiopsis]